METVIRKIRNELYDSEYISEAAEIIKNGGLVAFPTETVYGLGADGLNENAVEQIFKAKGRPNDNPLILHISDKEMLNPLVKEIPENAFELMDKFWPGPLTIIFKCADNISKAVTAGLDSVAIRMPNNTIAQALITEVGKPIAAPSANLSSKPSPTSAYHVSQDLNGLIPLILDGGNTKVGIESTVLDLSGENPKILRPGSITLEQLRELLPSVEYDKSITEETILEEAKSPGMKYKHYAPKAEMFVFVGEKEKVRDKIVETAEKIVKSGKNVGIMAIDISIYPRIGVIRSLSSIGSLEEIGQSLFSVLREFDDSEVDVILSEGFETSNLGMAIRNRMVKAASGNIINL